MLLNRDGPGRHGACCRTARCAAPPRPAELVRPLTTAGVREAQVGPAPVGWTTQSLLLGHVLGARGNDAWKPKPCHRRRKVGLYGGGARLVRLAAGSARRPPGRPLGRLGPGSARRGNEHRCTRRPRRPDALRLRVDRSASRGCRSDLRRRRRRNRVHAGPPVRSGRARCGAGLFRPRLPRLVDCLVPGLVRARCPCLHSGDRASRAGQERVLHAGLAAVVGVAPGVRRLPEGRSTVRLRAVGNRSRRQRPLSGRPLRAGALLLRGDPRDRRHGRKLRRRHPRLHLLPSGTCAVRRRHSPTSTCPRC